MLSKQIAQPRRFPLAHFPPLAPSASLPSSSPSFPPTLSPKAMPTRLARRLHSRHPRGRPSGRPPATGHPSPRYKRQCFHRGGGTRQVRWWRGPAREERGREGMTTRRRRMVNGRGRDEAIAMTKATRRGAPATDKHACDVCLWVMISLLLITPSSFPSPPPHSAPSL